MHRKYSQEKEQDRLHEARHLWLEKWADQEQAEIASEREPSPMTLDEDSKATDQWLDELDERFTERPKFKPSPEYEGAGVRNARKAKN